MDLQQYFIQKKVVCHCFSPDGKYIAISVKKTSQIEIYQLGSDYKKLSDWTLAWKLKEQIMTISAVDWTADYKILACSYDRKCTIHPLQQVLVYRFNQELKTWVIDLPLVLVDNDRGIVDGSWSPNGQKFVVGTSCSRVFVGYCEDRHDYEQTKFWQSKKISDNKSTVLSVRWHPSGRVIGVGSSDFTFMLVTAVIQDTEYVTNPLEDSSYSGTYASVNTFGDVLFRVYNTNGWVESLSFSPNGSRVVFAVHNGLVQLLDLSDDNVVYEGEGRALYPPALPFQKVKFVDNETVVAVGYDKKPALLKVSDKLTWAGFITTNVSIVAQGAKSNWRQISSNLKSISSQFEKKGVQQDDKGCDLSPIACIQRVPGGERIVSTNGVSGIICFWKY